ncbi:MAG: methylmalonyl Co-A mutase-associated GTPase MeaB [Phycisphaerales bacterium]|nr:MAG: methylmalonyl Co-A mutase-associated GTPase MeaB [Phycisphaerales bacterium]
MDPSQPKGEPVRRRELTLQEYESGVRRGDRAVLARAITLIESRHPRHLETAQQLLTRLMPYTGKSFRVGITGVPGVGKSTFIEVLGTNLTAAGHRVAVLAVDPSSGISGGSILGDKTRMLRLSTDPNAFIRPSPSAGTLGGVASKTREAMLLCEAASFDVVLVETVGVGQSEAMVAEMTDFFLVLMIPGAGDELQGIKRGLLEFADAIAVTKADGDNLKRAERATREYQSAMSFMRPREDGWTCPVLTCSARENTGLDRIWQHVVGHHEALEASGRLQARRREQMLRWMWALVDEQMHVMLTENQTVRDMLPELEQQVLDGIVPPTVGAHRIFAAFRSGRSRLPKGS